MAQHPPGPVVGIIGGSGIYDIDGLQDRQWVKVSSPFGEPSDEILTGTLFGQAMAFLPRDHLQQAAQDAGINAVRGGTYLAMEGPQFSSLAESQLYRQWGCDVIGMTNMPEAKLAREAEICYASVAMVTDYDCWHPDHDHVTVEQIIGVLMANANKGRSLVKQVVPQLKADAAATQCSCRSALQFALITAPEARDPVMLDKLSAVAGRMLTS
jgi:5'-methylthioadenosine phosphorylase